MTVVRYPLPFYMMNLNNCPLFPLLTFLLWFLICWRKAWFFLKLDPIRFFLQISAFREEKGKGRHTRGVGTSEYTWPYSRPLRSTVAVIFTSIPKCFTIKLISWDMLDWNIILFPTF